MFVTYSLLLNTCSEGGVVLFLVLSLNGLVAGGEGGAGIFPCGSFGYWVLVLTPLPIIVAIVWHMGNLVCSPLTSWHACHGDAMACQFTCV
jgi:hypothetical protein